ncbi:hypothetical protein Tco_0865636 [Tanacetum coccineum]
MEAHFAPKQPVQVNKITSLCEICSGPHDTQYCMENPEQAFVEYASSYTDEEGDMWYTLKHKQNNLGDTYNPSWNGHPNLSFNTQSNLEGLASNFMASQDARLSKFEADFKQQQSETRGLQTFTLADLGSYVNIIPLYLFKKLNIGLLEETDHVFGLAYGTKSYPVGIDPKTPLLVGRGFLATANAVIDCRKAKIAVGEGITRKEFMDYHLPGEWEIARDAKINSFKDVLVFRRMDRPPKNKDKAWPAKIRLIDPDGEEFTKTLQSIPTSRKLSKRESPREIINLDNFYDT